MDVQLLHLSVPTPKGHSVAVTKFVAPQAASYTMVITSATGVLQQYYAKFAQFFATNGITVYTFDYHGIGESSASTSELKTNTSDVISWGQNDQAAVVAFAKQENKDTKLILVGHSIGGQILGFNPNYHMIDKVILVASQTGYWKHFEGLHTLKMLLFWYVIVPLFTPIFGYFPAKKLGLFENLPKGVVYSWTNWGKHPKYLMRSYDEQKHLFDKFQMPMLALSFSKDSYAPLKAVELLVAYYKNVRLKRVHHQAQSGERHIKHFGFFKSWAQKPFWEQCLNYVINERYGT